MVKFSSFLFPYLLHCIHWPKSVLFKKNHPLLYLVLLSMKHHRFRFCWIQAAFRVSTVYCCSLVTDVFLKTTQYIIFVYWWSMQFYLKNAIVSIELSGDQNSWCFDSTFNLHFGSKHSALWFCGVAQWVYISLIWEICASTLHKFTPQVNG